jgi:hypothetical protein
MSLQETIAKSFNLRAAGKISDFDLAIAHQRRAEELGKSLTEFYACPEGQRALQSALRASYYEKQVDSSVGNGFPGVDQARDIHKARKAFGNPASSQSEFANPDVTTPSEEPQISGGRIPWPELFDRAVKLLMRARNCSRDAAITEIYRAEKRKKEEGYTSPKIRHAKPNPKDVLADSEEDDDDGPSRAKKTADAVKRYTDSGLGYLEAVTKVYRQQRGY